VEEVGSPNRSKSQEKKKYVGRKRILESRKPALSRGRKFALSAISVLKEKNNGERVKIEEAHKGKGICFRESAGVLTTCDRKRCGDGGGLAASRVRGVRLRRAHTKEEGSHDYVSVSYRG